VLPVGRTVWPRRDRRIVHGLALSATITGAGVRAIPTRVASLIERDAPAGSHPNSFPATQTASGSSSRGPRPIRTAQRAARIGPSEALENARPRGILWAGCSGRADVVRQGRSCSSRTRSAAPPLQLSCSSLSVVLLIAALAKLRAEELPQCCRTHRSECWAAFSLPPFTQVVTTPLATPRAKLDAKRRPPRLLGGDAAAQTVWSRRRCPPSTEKSSVVG